MSSPILIDHTSEIKIKTNSLQQEHPRNIVTYQFPKIISENPPPFPCLFRNHNFRNPTSRIQSTSENPRMTPSTHPQKVSIALLQIPAKKPRYPLKYYYLQNFPYRWLRLYSLININSNSNASNQDNTEWIKNLPFCAKVSILQNQTTKTNLPSREKLLFKLIHKN